MIITETQGQAAKQHPARAKMTLAQIARLAAIKEQDRADRESSCLLIEQFEKAPKDPWTLARILSRLSSDQSNLEKRALKLRCSVAHGWKPTDITGILFLAALTREQDRMSDEKFLHHLEATWPECKIEPAGKSAVKVCRGIRPSRVAKELVWRSDRQKSAPEVLAAQ